ncbi:hypothetical protein [Microbulbifer variabilis]|uniref:hypothetical protein n=1 Tax=Microbulbifer variabilis TaxID=266805 RepID=UPI001CFF541F|nr:hypothetical protein [Microbulbifer variabilis]
MKKAFIFLIVSFLSAGTFAATTNIGLVERIYPSGTSVKFRLKNDPCNVNSKGEYYEFELDTDVKKAWFTILLAAANSGKEVSVRVEACEGGVKTVVYIFMD